MDNIEKKYHALLYLLLLHFIIGVFFDFAASLYSFFIHTPLNYPALGDLSIAIWLLCTGFIFVAIWKILHDDKITYGLVTLFYLLFYGSGLHDVANAIQVKLWLLGYNDSLQYNLPQASNLPAISPNILPIFHLLYFYDEYLGHAVVFSGYFLFFPVFYTLALKQQPTSSPNSHNYHKLLFFLVAMLNGLYMAWNVIEGQSVILFLLVCCIMLVIKLYQHSRGFKQNRLSLIFEAIFSSSLVWIFIWIAFIGKFKTIPQFFETAQKWFY